jgi:hypothetical protein
MYKVLPPQTPGLVAYYNFNIGIDGGQNAGLVSMIDLTGNGNNGTLINFQLSGNNSNWVESYAVMAPFVLPAYAITSSGFTASWNKPSIGVVEQYLLDIAVDPLFNSFVPGYHDKPVTDNSQIVNNLQPGTVYYYRVRATKAAKDMQSSYSNTVSVRTGR